jgi:outer membrane protein
MMNTNRLISWIALALISLCSLSVAAQDLKIGYVNSERVLKEAAPAKVAQKKLEAEFGRRESELSEAAGKLKALADKYERDKLTMTASERDRQERSLVEQDRDLQRQRRDYQEDLNQRKSEELSALVERTNRVIKQIFDQEKYDLILQDAVFVSAKVDITEKVIKALNAAPSAASK